jgi:hypothetical protein
MRRLDGEMGLETGALTPATAYALLKLVLRRP